MAMTAVYISTSALSVFLSDSGCCDGACDEVLHSQFRNQTLSESLRLDSFLAVQFNISQIEKRVKKFLGCLQLCIYLSHG